MILFDRVSKKYGRRRQQKSTAVEDISFNIEAGEFVILVGPSGSGKSTILKLLTMAEYPTSGSISVGGLDYSGINRRDRAYLRRKIGTVFQDFKLLSDKTVYENVAFSLLIIGAGKKTINRIVPRILKVVGLDSVKNKFPAELSGGEAQRVAIARSLVLSPKILLADEPTGNLDLSNSWDVVELLVKINDFGKTILLATHDQEIVKRLKKRILLIENGRIVSS